MSNDAAPKDSFPLRACILLGIGLGGFFDGIVFHQLLQWHHMVSNAGWPPDTLHNLQVNTVADGLFHVVAWLCVLVGLLDLWRSARRPHPGWRWRRLAGGILLGFGLFNLVEGLVDHQLLGLHHVNETAPRDRWFIWDMAFLVWGLCLIAGGWGLLRQPTPRPRPGMAD
jgi:uncharacterized membrane protein